MKGGVKVEGKARHKGEKVSSGSHLDARLLGAQFPVTESIAFKRFTYLESFANSIPGGEMIAYFRVRFPRSRMSRDEAPTRIESSPGSICHRPSFQNLTCSKPIEKTIVLLSPGCSETR
jgi:hypothetical protein